MILLWIAVKFLVIYYIANSKEGNKIYKSMLEEMVNNKNYLHERLVPNNYKEIGYIGIAILLIILF